MNLFAATKGQNTTTAINTAQVHHKGFCNGWVLNSKESRMFMLSIKNRKCQLFGAQEQTKLDSRRLDKSCFEQRISSTPSSYGIKIVCRRDLSSG
ncbi:hypothetical protein CDAR_302171 [Caerostris darwini]|uniref:Uncharacterized protein n=1 Tax=Caerostris darwini TaxID=1538125 RepID=A0AAV4SDM5_9ARAC|nr:hypothetical protein CDAR_302171 [Caerostris darwini]